MIGNTMRAVAIAVMLATVPGGAGAQVLFPPPVDNLVPDPALDMPPPPPKKRGEERSQRGDGPDRQTEQRDQRRQKPERRAEPDRPAPSANQIQRQLEAAPRVRVAPERRVTIREFKRRPDLRRAAPSIDIQAINFAFGSADIPVSQYRKIENIATAIDRLLDRRPDTRVLIEGHTDAVGSFSSNQILSERRAASLKRTLVREFGIPPHVLETVGYGEEFLLVPTDDENWQNRRVTLRRIDDFVRY